MDFEEENFLLHSLYFGKELNTVIDETNALSEFFPDIFSMNNPGIKLCEGIEADTDQHIGDEGLDVGFGVPPVESEVIKNQDSKNIKKRGRPRKKREENTSKPTTNDASSSATTMMSKRKRKSSGQKAQHRKMERDRRKGISDFLKRLRGYVPRIMTKKKPTIIEILEEAAIYLKEEKPGFLLYLKEKQKLLRLEARRRQLESELASKGLMCVWPTRKGMSKSEIYQSIKREGREDMEDEEINKAILELN